MPDLRIKPEGSWINPTDVQVKPAGSWLPATQVWTKVSGVWQLIWERPVDPPET